MSKDAFASNKILGHLDTLNRYLNGDWYPPILVEIDLTNLCASACPWCAGYLNRKWTNHTLMAPEKGDRWEASTNGVCELLQDLRDIGVQAVTWTGGGDPTQHKGLDKALLDKRSRAGANMIPATATGLRHLYAHVRAGRGAGVLPPSR